MSNPRFQEPNSAVEKIKTPGPAKWVVELNSDLLRRRKTTGMWLTSFTNRRKRKLKFQLNAGQLRRMALKILYSFRLPPQKWKYIKEENWATNSLWWCDQYNWTSFKGAFFPEISCSTAPTRISVSVKSLSSPRKFAISFIQWNALWVLATTLSKTADPVSCKRLASFPVGQFSDWPKKLKLSAITNHNRDAVF